MNELQAGDIKLNPVVGGTVMGIVAGIVFAFFWISFRRKKNRL